MASSKEVVPTFMKGLAAPGRRALAEVGVIKAEDLARFSEKEIANLHGMGGTGMVRLKQNMADADVQFRS